jgi:transposase
VTSGRWLAEHDVTELEQRLLAENAQLKARVAELEETVRKLLAKLGQHSGNSSKPPSSDPPWRSKPNPPKPPTGRKPGGQPGHKPHNRELLEPNAPPVDCTAERCPFCKAGVDCAQVIPGAEQIDQIIEVPVEPVIQNFSRPLYACGQCGKRYRAPRPKAAPPTAAGPRLQAIIATLIGQFHLSRADVKVALAQMFGIDLSVGAIHAVTERAAQAVGPAVRQVAKALIDAATKHCDETGWRHMNKRAWLWVCSHPEIGAHFTIHHRRNREAFAELLPELKGVIHTDRWNVYDIISAVMHQLCHAHLRRDMQALVELKGATGEIGTAFLAASDEMFKVWHAFRNGKLTRDELLRQMQPVQQTWRTLAERARQDTHQKCRALGKDLLKQWDSLWPFLHHEGAEPTNNHAERVIRPGVLCRKVTGGTRSEAGASFVARIQSVIATAKCQGLDLVDWLQTALEALWQPMAFPGLLPEVTDG